MKNNAVSAAIRLSALVEAADLVDEARQIVRALRRGHAAAGGRSSIAAPITLPLLRPHADPTDVVIVGSGAMSRLLETGCDASDGLETGGYLYYWNPGGRPDVLDVASGPGENAVHLRGKLKMDIKEHERWVAQLREESGYDLVRCGIWHTHRSTLQNARPDHQPSDGDLEALGAGYELLEVESGRSDFGFTGLILTKRDYPNADWTDPEITAWVVRRDPVSRHLVCEQARVRED